MNAQRPHPEPRATPTTSARELSVHERDVLQAIRDTRYGTVEVTVHQSRIVQITRSEKVRFDAS
jgi:hypothetical protein